MVLLPRRRRVQITPDQARSWITLFPRHPIVWLVSAALIAFIVVRRPPPETSSAATSQPASRLVTLDRTARAAQYAWLSRKSQKSYQPVIERIATPEGVERAKLPEGSFGDS